MVSEKDLQDNVLFCLLGRTRREGRLAVSLVTLSGVGDSMCLEDRLKGVAKYSMVIIMAGRRV